MQDIRRVIRSAGRRLILIEFLRNAVFMLSVAAGGVLVTRIVERTFGFVVPWQEVFIWSAGGAVLAAALWTLMRRSSEHQVARELDERAGLRESLSTALIVAHEKDPWSRVVVETARARAKKVKVRRAVPLEAPRAWPIPIAIAAATAAIWFTFPDLDVLGKLADRQQMTDAQNELDRAKRDIAAQEKKIESKLADAGLDPLEFLIEEVDLSEPSDANAARRQRVMKLTEMAEKIDNKKNGEKGMQLDALRDALRKMKQPGPGPMDKLSRSLARGDFKKAQELLKELQNKLASGELSAEDKAKLQLQMKNMSEQLERASKDKKALENKLRQAGMSKEQAQKAAASPEQLKKALEQLKNMSDEQKQQLMRQAAAQAKACQQCSNMGNAMSKAAQSMSQGGSGEQGMEGMSGQLSEMEMLAGEMGALDETYQEAMKQLSEMSQSMGEAEWAQCMGEMAGAVPQIGQWRPGENQSQGLGSGGPGQGLGANTGAEAAAFTLKNRKSPVSTTGRGPIIGQRDVYDELIRGESTAVHSEVFESGAHSAAEALDTQQIAPERRDAVREYFSSEKSTPAQPGDESDDDDN